ncbi:hypothetical protein ABZV67_25695 [Streptomyces sp. NPDC005065]|uniref:hypothetical protein n=1 Tax=unclassified Streptomyces TaxID=2593676 RepID=UPI0033B07716
MAKSRAGDSTRPTSSSVSPPRCASVGDSPRADSWTITEQAITSAAGAAPTTGHEAGLVGGQVEHAVRDRMCLRTSEWDGMAHSVIDAVCQLLYGRPPPKVSPDNVPYSGT